MRTIVLLCITLSCFATIVGCGSRQPTYVTCCDNKKVHIDIENRILDGSSFYFSILTDDKVTYGPIHLGPCYSEKKFDSIVLKDAGILAIYEKSRPDNVIIIVDCNNLIFWPNAQKGEGAKLIAMLRTKTNNTNYQLCDLE